MVKTWARERGAKAYVRMRYAPDSSARKYVDAGRVRALGRWGVSAGPKDCQYVCLAASDEAPLCQRRGA
jgi:hypothetical protein